MKLILAGYIVLGFMIGMFLGDSTMNRLTFTDVLIVIGIHVPAVLFVVLAWWHSKKHGTFMGATGPLFTIAAVVSYVGGRCDGSLHLTGHAASVQREASAPPRSVNSSSVLEPKLASDAVSTSRRW